MKRVVFSLLCFAYLFSCEKSGVKSEMELWIADDHQSIEKCVSKNASASEINKLVDSLNWADFHYIWLKDSTGNILEISGDLIDNGISTAYQSYDKNGSFITEEISDNPVWSKIEIKKILTSFCTGDGNWKKSFSNLK